MIFQGTVWAPILWNVFFEDARRVIRSCGFIEGVYADDIISFKDFDRDLPDNLLLDELSECQRRVPAWDNANRIIFDAGKEKVGILGNRNTHCENFR